MEDQFRAILRQVGDALGESEAAFGLVNQLQDHTENLVADLIEALRDDEPLVQAAAAFSLGHVWYVLCSDEIDACSSIPKLLTLIDIGEPRVAFEATTSVAVLQVGGTTRLSEKQILDSYFRCLKLADPSLKVEIAGQLLAIVPEAITELAGLLDAESIQEALEDAESRWVRRVPD